MGGTLGPVARDVLLPEVGRLGLGGGLGAGAGAGLGVVGTAASFALAEYVTLAEDPVAIALRQLSLPAWRWCP